MEPQKPKTSPKDFFLNVGSIISLGIIAGYLIDLLFTVINRAYPPISSYSYYGSYSISWPVATLIIFFPVYILLMWLLEREYAKEPERRGMGVRKWLTYITLFLAGLTIAGDLVTVLFTFIDGQEITTGFIFKVLVVLVIAGGIFFYYIKDAMNTLNSASRKMWAGAFFIVILASITWGFSVLGSPRTQQLIKYDEQKVNDLTNIQSQIEGYYSIKNALPNTLSDIETVNYSVIPVDMQTNKSYDYKKASDTKYSLCGEFNSASPDVSQPNIYMRPVGHVSWVHPAGKYCFDLTLNPKLYPPKGI